MTYKNTNELVYAIGKRVQEMADYPLPFLRKIAEADISCNTRGKLLEWIIMEEFLEDDPKAIVKVD